jgi:DNA processing protein
MNAVASPRPTAARACTAALSGLPHMGPRRLTALLGAWPAAEAWERVASGSVDRLCADATVAARLGATDASRRTLVAAWAAAASRIDPAELLRRHEVAGISILLRGDDAYPAALLTDLEPPEVLYARGDLAALDAGPTVALVGTRRCTGLGAGVARELGRELSAAGAVVLSGLALGIDGAAHRGALEARAADGESSPPVGVVGSGLDVVYPASHIDLWNAVAAHGLLLAEVPLGVRPAPWRFPARNRLIAALADVVVVVESHPAGGSMHTVREAERRDVPVMAVPGSVRSPAAGGTNQLVSDGCHPVLDASDVLVALGLTAARRRDRREVRPAPGVTERAVLDAFDWEPATLEHLAVRTGLGLADLAVALEWLQLHGWVDRSGGWFERVGEP